MYTLFPIGIKQLIIPEMYIFFYLIVMFLYKRVGLAVVHVKFILVLLLERMIAARYKHVIKYFYVTH